MLFRHNAYMSDLWASAVCLWIFIFGTLPFQHENILILFEMIRLSHIIFVLTSNITRIREPIMPHPVSPELTDLFQALFRKNPAERPSIVDIQAHYWVLGTLPEQYVMKIILSADIFRPDDADSPRYIGPKPQFSPRILSKINM